MDAALDMALLFRVVILAIIQGIAEFLPISSSGHLLVLGHLFEMPDNFTLMILLHLGTLFAVLVFFRKEILAIFTYRKRALGLIIVGSIPTAIIGLVLQKLFPQLETSRLMTGVGFLLTGTILITIMRRHSRTESEEYYEKIAYEEEGYDGPVTEVGRGDNLAGRDFYRHSSRSCRLAWSFSERFDDFGGRSAPFE